MRRVFEVKKVTREGKVFYKYRNEFFPGYLWGGNAAEHIRETAGRYCAGKGIDVGADQWPYPGAIPVRNEPHQNAYLLDNFADDSLDYVHSSHCLEHLERWQEALALWTRKLKPGGILFLYLPHEAMKLWNPGSPWVGKGHVWQPTIEVLLPLLDQLGYDMVEHNPGHDHYYSFHVVARKR
ncbi:MAG: methyltransferase domain-containing protein [Bacteroidetes bacterium]|nr:methyltransferase domain-containing protein [Bacteroidota bacterium]